MNIQTGTEFEEYRPKLVPSLKRGLDIIANHLWLILLPIVLDVELWLAPHLGVRSAAQPLLDEINQMLSANPQQLPNNMDLTSTQKIWETVVSQFNLFTALRTYPLGIPSLMAAWMPAETPYGAAKVIDVANSSQIFLIWIALGLIGLILTSLLYSKISQMTSNKKEEPVTPGLIGWITLQLLLLTVILFAMVLFVVLPVMVVLSGVMVANQNIGLLAFFIVSLSAVWLLFPLVFSAHGIFTDHLPLFKSISTSIQVVRLSLPSTSLFVLVCVVLNQGLTMLWQVPQENSWLLLVGIFGHAFISMSLVAASFYFYRDAVRFYQTVQAKYQLISSSTITK